MSRAQFLEVDDVKPVELAAMLDAARRWKADASAIPSVLAGAGAALVFEKP